jgi:predicted dehydrogenase
MIENFLRLSLPRIHGRGILMEKGKTLRIGFIGAGSNTRLRHLPGFAGIEGVELAVVANRSRASSEAVAKEFGIARVADGWRAVAEDPEVDAVCIGTWPNLHAEATIAALGNGKHVLCEARMARDLGEARAMLEASRKHPDRIAQIVPAPFSLDHDALIRRELAAGKLGRLLEVRVTHTAGQQADPAAPMSWRQDVELSGRNVLTMGILHETVERWMEDEPEWVLADAAVFTPERRYPDAEKPVPVKIPESISILGRFGGSGARLVYHFSGVESGRPVMEIRLNGDKGGFRFDAVAGRLFHAPAGSAEEEVVEPPAAEQRGWQVEADFVRSIRESAPVTLTSFEQGLRYMTFTERVFDSWTAGGRKVGWDR